MRKNSYIRKLTESQTLGYILRSISEGKNEEQIAERFDGDTELVKTSVDALKQIHFLVKNYFDKLVVTPDGIEYLLKFNPHW
jgi:Ribonuclease G/E